MVKKYYFSIVLLLISISGFSQCGTGPNDPTCRGVLAGVIFESLYFENPNVYDYEASSFPNPFVDLQEDNELNTKLKVLSYLAYDNGVTVYNYSNEPSTCFKPFSTITWIEALIYIMEAWNIESDFSGNPNDVVGAYTRRAINEGLLNNISNFNAFEPLTNNEVVLIINNVTSNPSLHPVREDLNDRDNYFVPGIYTPINLSQTRGLNQGVFNHYAKNSFSIPDIKMSLDFSHFYSTTLVELPEDFYPIKPLGRGWSHTYNSYIVRENNVGTAGDDYYFIVYPDGSIHIYNEDENEYESIGVYDELSELSGDRIRIRKKNQMDYYYRQIDNDKNIWYLVEIEDTNDNRIVIDYERSDLDNDQRRIQNVRSPSGKRLEFEYTNNTDYIRRITDPIGRELRFDLDTNDDNRLESFTDARGNETEYKYVENDVDAPFGDQIKRFLLDEIELPRGNRIRAQYDEDNGKLMSYQIDEDDPIAVDVDFDYDRDEMTARVITPVPGNDALTEQFEFNMNGLIVDYESEIDDLNVEYPTRGPNLTLPDNSNLNGVRIDYEFDDRGNALVIDKENGTAIERMRYSNENELTRYTDPNGNETSFDYDNNRNITRIQDPLGNVTTMTYDNLGQMLARTNQEGITVEYTYENDGAVSSMTAPEDITSNYSYDGVNRLLTANNSGLISNYAYDNNDNITSMTNSGGFTTTYDYDANDNVTEILNPNNVATRFVYDDEDRVITETFGSLVKRYTYDDEGFLERYTKPSGARINYDYDADGRPTRTGTTSNVSYNNDNLVRSITNDSRTISFNYDVLNRVDRVETVHGHIVQYEYRPSNHLREIEYPVLNNIPVQVNYSYDDKNRVRNVRVTRDGVERTIAEYQYLKDDRISRMECGNNVRTIYEYDDAGRKTNIEHNAVGNGNTFYQQFNELDNRGNITRTDELARPIENRTTSEQRNVNYDYDNNSHIENAGSDGYDVDSDGNTINSADQIAIQYDIDDRLTRYDGLDNDFRFGYNGYNQRIEITDNNTTTRFVRDVLKDNILIEIDGNNNPIYYYIYGPNGMLLARMNQSGDLHYYHGDIRGSVVALTDESDTITNLYRYNDFGEIIASTEPANEPNRFKYVGLYGVEHDTDNLYYMRARYYQPTIGRFLTEDPIWSTNLYPYADNNPISRIDPDGEFANFVIGAVTSVGIGYGISLLTGEEYTWEQAATDAALGAAGVGIVKGFKVARTIYKTQKLTTNSAKILAKTPSGGGWLQFHEKVGHTIKNHVGHTDSQLISRLKNSSSISGASTFTNQSTAEAVIGSTIRGNRATIKAWLRNGSSSRLNLNFNENTIIGRGIARGESSVSNRTSALIVLKRNGRGGYNVLTAFPK